MSHVKHGGFYESDFSFVLFLPNTPYIIPFIDPTHTPASSISFCLSPSLSVGFFLFLPAPFFIFSSLHFVPCPYSLFPSSLSHSPFLYTTISLISITLIDFTLSPLLHLILFLHSLTPSLYHNRFHSSHPLLLLESYRTRFNRAEGASDDPELAALALLVESNCKIGGGGSKLPTHTASVRGGLRWKLELRVCLPSVFCFFLFSVYGEWFMLCCVRKKSVYFVCIVLYRS